MNSTRRAFLVLTVFLLSGTRTRVLAAAYDDFLNAVKIGNAAETKRLLSRGMDPNTVDAAGQPALHLAAREGKLEVIQALAEARADLNRRNGHAETAIMLAALAGHADVAQYLISRDVQINHPGWTPLIYAASNGHRRIVEMLLDKHAYIDAAPENGITALMIAARGGHQDVVKVLLEEGADASLANDRGETAIDWAMVAKNTYIAALIQARIKKP